MPFIHDEDWHRANTRLTLHNAVTEPAGWYSFNNIDQIRWISGTNHLQWYTKGLESVSITADNININGQKYPGRIYQFSFPTPTNIPNLYAEDLTVMNLFVKIPDGLSLTNSPDDGYAFINRLVRQLIISACFQN
jgi:hypothetical protein